MGEEFYLVAGRKLNAPDGKRFDARVVELELKARDKKPAPVLRVGLLVRNLDEAVRLRPHHADAALHLFVGEAGERGQIVEGQEAVAGECL